MEKTKELPIDYLPEQNVGYTKKEITVYWVKPDGTSEARRKDLTFLLNRGVSGKL